MFITRHDGVLDPGVRNKLWRLYELSYAQTAPHAASYEMVQRDEFDDHLASATNETWVGWDDDVPIALTVVCRELRRARFLSEPYFDIHYPEYMARNAVRYVRWVVVHPDHQASGDAARLAREVFSTLHEQNVLMVFDTPSITQPTDTGGFAGVVEILAHAAGATSPVELLDVQRYWAIEMGQPVDRQRQAVADAADVRPTAVVTGAGASRPTQ